MLPGIRGVAVERVTVGHRVMPVDEYPIVGFCDRCPNLYIAAMHSGVTLAPLIGQLAALEILDGARVSSLEPYRPVAIHRLIRRLIVKPPAYSETGSSVGFAATPFCVTSLPARRNWLPVGTWKLI